MIAGLFSFPEGNETPLSRRANNLTNSEVIGHPPKMGEPQSQQWFCRSFMRCGCIFQV
jgi:hypothetical protein